MALMMMLFVAVTNRSSLILNRPLWTERNISGQCDLRDVFLFWKQSRSWRPLLYFLFISQGNLIFIRNNLRMKTVTLGGHVIVSS